MRGGGSVIYHEASPEDKDCGGLNNSTRAEKGSSGGSESPAYVMGYDGDLIVHPEDMRLCLETPGEYAAYSDITTDEPILASVNEKNEITAFSMKTGNYEWTGPLCMERDRIKYTSENIYKMLGRYLPMRGLKIRACDIDTYEDYKRAAVFMKEWYGV